MSASFLAAAYVFHHDWSANMARQYSYKKCSICYSVLAELEVWWMPCAHEFCQPCISAWIDRFELGAATCPLCRADLEEEVQVDLSEEEEEQVRRREEQVRRLEQMRRREQQPSSEEREQMRQRAEEASARARASTGKGER